MRIARVCRAKYPDLDGKGGTFGPARWNSKGTRIVYTSSCGALAVLEYRVHTTSNPDDLLLVTIEIPDALKIEKLDWMPDVDTSRHLGDVWVASKRTPVLQVLSVVVPDQRNYLLNPQHPDLVGNMKIINKQPFMLDVRLFNLVHYP